MNGETKKAFSFYLGYNNVKAGKISRELTPREITLSWPDVNEEYFAQGVIDALCGDSFRYVSAKMELQQAGLLQISEQS